MPGALLYVARDFREFGVSFLTAFMRSRCIDGAREQRVREFNAAIVSTNYASRFRLRRVGVIYQADRRLRQRAEFEQCVACTPR